MSYWSQKNCVVIGGSRGLGLAIARAIVAAGGHVVLVARNEADLTTVAEELGSQSSSIRCDITDQADVDELFARLGREFSSIHAVFHVAGKSARQAILDTSAEDFHDLMNVNFYAAVRCAQQAAPMLTKSRGHLVLVGSLASKTASKFIGPYAATKFALAAYAQQLRLELSDDGLHVLHVCPGPIARDDAGDRYNDQTSGLPESARKPGAGAKLNPIDPNRLATQILQGCEQRKIEIVVPWKAKLLFVISQISPRMGDWLLARRTKS